MQRKVAETLCQFISVVITIFCCALYLAGRTEVSVRAQVPCYGPNIDLFNSRPPGTTVTVKIDSAWGPVDRDALAAGNSRWIGKPRVLTLLSLGLSLRRLRTMKRFRLTELYTGRNLTLELIITAASSGIISPPLWAPESCPHK